MPPGGYYDTTTYDNGILTYTSEGTCAATAANISFQYGATSGGYGSGYTSATAILSVQTLTNMGTSIMGWSNQSWGHATYGSGGGGGGTPNWEPVQAAALRKDWEDFKKSWKRKRAEVKARRFFRRVVGDVAWRKFEEKGYHEIYGASRTRYRLRPAFRVQVMKEGDTVDYELCAHLEIGIPWFDSMAVQHLMLTSAKESEEKFKSIANHHRAHGPYPIDEMTAAA